MNVMRMVVLGVAAIAAGGAAMLVRGMMGGGTTTTQASLPTPALMEVLVASADIAPGHTLDVGLVRWQVWPKNAVSASLITKEQQPDIAKAVEGAVVRSPLLPGQPITEASIVRAGSSGFLAATIKPGMRAVAVPVAAETSAGGFVLPNDRVDVLFTRDLMSSGPKKVEIQTILRDIRVLAVDQTAQGDKAQQSVVGKTATLELTPAQAEVVVRSQKEGTLSLALRPLGENGIEVAEQPVARPKLVSSAGPAPSPTVVVYRYGVLRDTRVNARTAVSGPPVNVVNNGGSDDEPEPASGKTGAAQDSPIGR